MDMLGPGDSLGDEDSPDMGDATGILNAYQDLLAGRDPSGYYPSYWDLDIPCWENPDAWSYLEEKGSPVNKIREVFATKLGWVARRGLDPRGLEKCLPSR
jgi:hypothetical protein